MKKCLVVPLVGLAISFALPTYAQQKDVADPQTTQKILALCKANDEAHMNNDATAVATLFTRDAVLVPTYDSGPITGRPAIQKYYTDLYQRWHPIGGFPSKCTTGCGDIGRCYDARPNAG